MDLSQDIGLLRPYRLSGKENEGKIFASVQKIKPISSEKPGKPRRATQEEIEKLREEFDVIEHPDSASLSKYYIPTKEEWIEWDVVACLGYRETTPIVNLIAKDYGLEFSLGCPQIRATEEYQSPMVSERVTNTENDGLIYSTHCLPIPLISSECLMNRISIGAAGRHVGESAEMGLFGLKEGIDGFLNHPKRIRCAGSILEMEKVLKENLNHGPFLLIVKEEKVTVKMPTGELNRLQKIPEECYIMESLDKVVSSPYLIDDEAILIQLSSEGIRMVMNTPVLIMKEGKLKFTVIATLQIREDIHDKTGLVVRSKRFQ